MTLKPVYFAGLLALMLAPVAGANCIKVTATTQLSTSAINAGYVASSWTGACDGCTAQLGLSPMISIGSGVASLPSGTVLSAATGNFITQAVKDSDYSANRVLFRCAKADEDSLYEMYATAGSNPYAGQYPVEDIEGGYYTYAKNVALRITNLKTGLYYTNRWQSRKLSSSEWYDDGTYIFIPASAFSDAFLELIKTDQTSYFSSGASTVVYKNPTSNGYLVFKGPGMATAISEGGDSGSQKDGYYTYWPGAWSLYNSITVTRGAMCILKDYTDRVVFPKIGTGELNSGGVSQQPFSITLDCDKDAVSGVTSSSSNPNVAVGFLVNQQIAVEAAETLGLKNSSGGITWLLDNNYGAEGVASGVGIRVYDSSMKLINLLSSRVTGGGESAGWYAYKDITEYVGDNEDTTLKYTGDFISALEALPGNEATAGTVDAQLQVVVSFQ
ncbi:fimbrial usher protein StbD [Pseudocitrobacter cyperus]|uniref:Fimbrial usher protein StbD n=1 Tax=Pseudocitrobacter cyperus TaxID=3112843 RepID=A0ABV0HHQ8_9ENTR